MMTEAGDDYQRILYLLSVSSTTPGRRSIRTWQLVWSAGLMFTSSNHTWQEKRKNLETRDNLRPQAIELASSVQSRKRKIMRIHTANLDDRFSAPLRQRKEKAWNRGRPTETRHLRLTSQEYVILPSNDFDENRRLQFFREL